MSGKSESAGNIELEAVLGDITREQVDAIVNAANESLLGGGGVDGAIHRAAGPGLLDECRRLGGCPTGDARMTGGYDLPAKHVIHTVGPRWHGGDQGEAELLASCYRRCLALAEASGLERLAFPAISTGVFGYPLKAATRIAVDTVSAHGGPHVKLVRFVCFDRETLDAYREALAQTG